MNKQQRQQAMNFKASFSQKDKETKAFETQLNKALLAEEYTAIETYSLGEKWDFLTYKFGYVVAYEFIETNIKLYRKQFLAYMEHKDWIKSVLSNDENSTDEELVEYFVQEGLTQQQAVDAVSKREFYLNNIVLDDGSIYKPRI